MRTSYFTFGQSHTHSFNGRTLDKDTVLKITADDPRLIMHSLFGAKWSMEYDSPPDMTLFPGGIVSIPNNKPPSSL